MRPYFFLLFMVLSLAMKLEQQTALIVITLEHWSLELPGERLIRVSLNPTRTLRKKRKFYKSGFLRYFVLFNVKYLFGDSHVYFGYRQFHTRD